MALLQQHDARRDIVIEPAAWRRAAIEARGRSKATSIAALKRCIIGGKLVLSSDRKS